MFWLHRTRWPRGICRARAWFSGQPEKDDDDDDFKVSRNVEEVSLPVFQLHCCASWPGIWSLPRTRQCLETAWLLDYQNGSCQNSHPIPNRDSSSTACGHTHSPESLQWSNSLSRCVLCLQLWWRGQKRSPWSPQQASWVGHGGGHLCQLWTPDSGRFFSSDCVPCDGCCSLLPPQTTRHPPWPDPCSSSRRRWWGGPRRGCGLPGRTPVPDNSKSRTWTGVCIRQWPRKPRQIHFSTVPSQPETIFFH